MLFSIAKVILICVLSKYIKLIHVYVLLKIVNTYMRINTYIWILQKDVLSLHQQKIKPWRQKKN